MRRGIAIVFTLILGWLLIVPAVVSADGSNLPACCRKNGKHHCSVKMMDPTGQAIAAISEKCPCCPQSTTAASTQFSGLALRAAVFAELVSHPAVAPQTEASYRISYERSRHKRGPPALILS